MGLYDSWLDLRDRCLQSEAFHQFAARMPFTRPIVRKRQSELFDLVSGFVYSQILLACIEFDVFSHIGSGISLELLAEKIDLGVDETRRLADGAASLRLLQKRKAVYRLGDLGAALVANPGVIAMVRHHPCLYRDLQDPVDFLRSGRGETHLSRFWDYGGGNGAGEGTAQQADVYSKLMATSQAMVSSDINAAIDFSAYRTLLDIGGGHGAFIRSVAEQNPNLKLQLFDLPAVAAQAEGVIARAGLAERIEIFSGSFFDDDLPKGADLMSLVRIIHDHDDEPALAILKAVYKALDDGGTLILCEPMSTGGYASRISDAYFNFYLYAMGRGQPRSLGALQHLLQSAGFQHIKHIRTRFPLITSILSAQKVKEKV